MHRTVSIPNQSGCLQAEQSADSLAAILLRCYACWAGQPPDMASKGRPVRAGSPTLHAASSILMAASRPVALHHGAALTVQGTLRVLLVLLHDFPEFLCEYHFELCNKVPPSCIQMRNLILSAFPRMMRLPDPFTPNLKV